MQEIYFVDLKLKHYVFFSNFISNYDENLVDNERIFNLKTRKKTRREMIFLNKKVNKLAKSFFPPLSICSDPISQQFELEITMMR